MKLYERIENNNFDEIDKDRAIELIKNGNGHLIYNENYFKLQNELEIKRKEYEETYKNIREELKELKKENEELKSEKKKQKGIKIK